MSALLLSSVIALGGETAIADVPSVETGAVGRLRLGLDGTVSTSDTFPEPGVQHRRVTTGFSFAIAPIDGWELFGSIGGSTLSGPHRIAAQGDLRIGAKWRVLGSRFVALDAVYLLPAGVDGSFPAFAGSSVQTRLIAGRPVAHVGGFDLRIDGAVGYWRDNTSALVGGQELTPAQAYGMGIRSGPSVTAGVALSAHRGAWMPYAELSGAYPLTEPTTAAPRLSDLRATAGLRASLSRGVALDAAAQFGLLEAEANALFLTAPPVTFRAGLAIAFDVAVLLATPERVALDLPPPEPRRPAPEAQPAPQPIRSEPPAVVADGLFAGTVRSAGGVPLSGATIETSDGTVLTDDAGRFALRVAPGRISAVVRHPRHLPLTFGHDVAAGETTSLALEINPRDPEGSLVAAFSTGDKPVNVHLEGPGGTLDWTSKDGRLEVEHLSAGLWRLVAKAEGHLMRARFFDVSAWRVTPVELTLPAAPTRSNLERDAQGGRLALRNGLRLDAAQPSQEALLDELADALLESDRRWRVVAAQKPAWVVEALVLRGVPSDRLEAVTAPGQGIRFEAVP
jgi:hypothetical protein